jgi:hypothetical protein
MDVVALSQLNDLLTKTGNNTDAAGAATLFAQLARIYAAVDQVEGYTDTLEAILGLTSDAASNNGNVMQRLAQLVLLTDTLETVSGQIKAKTDLIGAAADAAGTATMFARLAQLAGYTDSLEGVLGTNADAAATNASMWAMLKTLNAKPAGVAVDKSACIPIGQNAIVASTTAYQTLLSKTGKGYIEEIVTLGATQIHWLKVTIDGSVVFEANNGGSYSTALISTNNLSDGGSGNSAINPPLLGTVLRALSVVESYSPNAAAKTFTNNTVHIFSDVLYFKTSLLIEYKANAADPDFRYHILGGSY